MMSDRSNTWSLGFNKFAQLGRKAFPGELDPQKGSQPETGPEARQTSDGIVKKEEDWPKYAIPLKDFTHALWDSRQQGRIDPYQAYLLLAVNCNQLPDTGSSHPFQFIALHNDRSLGFPQKIDVLKSQLRAAGVADDIRAIFGLTMDNIIAPSVGYQPSYNDGERQPERKLLWVSRSETYSAIPKDVFLPMISRAMHEGSMNSQQAAMLISVNCHSLERRRTGERYLDHVMAVSAAEDLTPIQRCVTLLHDVVEDSNYTLEDLMAAGLRRSIVAGVDGATIRKGERYSDYLMRCSLNPDSGICKEHDAKHNLSTNPGRKKVVYPINLAYLRATRERRIEAGADLETWAREEMPEDKVKAYLDYWAKKAEESKTKYNFHWPFGS